VRRSAPRALLLSNPRCQQGVTLIELMVTLVILSILAAAAVPYAELTVRRNHELELRRSLRDIRSAIDRLHDDWETGKISKLGNAVSEDGYPKTLGALVEGVEAAQAKGGKIKYLRRIPPDPFAEAGKLVEEQWGLRGYQDEVNSILWGGRDVFDVRSASGKKAIDGSLYKDW
jgi:general secretion pathway protein G